jgi:hypothetical protein
LLPKDNIIFFTPSFKTRNKYSDNLRIAVRIHLKQNPKLTLLATVEGARRKLHLSKNNFKLQVEAEFRQM